jgi:hypothetical protein
MKLTKCKRIAYSVMIGHLQRADQSGRAVQGTNCLRSLERWDLGFESYSRHGCALCVYSVCIVLCVGRGRATG